MAIVNLCRIATACGGKHIRTGRTRTHCFHEGGVVGGVAELVCCCGQHGGGGAVDLASVVRLLLVQQLRVVGFSSHE